MATVGGRLGDAGDGYQVPVLSGSCGSAGGAPPSPGPPRREAHERHRAATPGIPQGHPDPGLPGLPRRPRHRRIRDRPPQGRLRPPGAAPSPPSPGARAKKPLSQRWHACPCGTEGDRDMMSALLAACVTLTDTDDPKTARLDPALREHARLLVKACHIKHIPVSGEPTAQHEGPTSRSTIHHNPATGTGGDGSHPVVAPAGQGERPAQPRHRNHGHPWGRRRSRRTSSTPSDPQAAPTNLWINS